MKLYRPVTVLVGVVLVIVAGLIRLAEPDQLLEATNRYTVHGKVGRALDGVDFKLTVNRVKLAREVDPRPDDDDSEASEDNRPVQTNGIFVTVEYQIEGRRRKGTAGDATLKTAGGAVYVPINQIIRTSMYIPPPGFVETATMIFEADPDDLAGLTLWIKPTRFLTVTTEDYAIELGVPDKKAARALLDDAERSYPITEPSMRALQ